MKNTSETYKSHRIEVGNRPSPSSAEAGWGPGRDVDLFIDGKKVPHGVFPDGTYFLRENAYERGEDLPDLARRLIDYRERSQQVRRALSGSGE